MLTLGSAWMMKTFLEKKSDEWDTVYQENEKTLMQWLLMLVSSSAFSKTLLNLLISYFADDPLSKHI